jgi:hypothetical protein
LQQRRPGPSARERGAAFEHDLPSLTTLASLGCFAFFVDDPLVVTGDDAEHRRQQTALSLFYLGFLIVGGALFY